MATTYRVVSQRPSTQLTADGRFIDTVIVNFETLPNQSPGTIEVPSSMYTVDYVKSVIEDKVAHMVAIENL